MGNRSLYATFQQHKLKIKNQKFKNLLLKIIKIKNKKKFNNKNKKLKTKH